MAKKVYYENGRYYPEESDEKQYYSKTRKMRWKKICAIGISCALIIGLTIKLTVYTDQYYWSNELVWAVKNKDVPTVKRLLESKNMDINKLGGVEFPAYIIGLSECSRSTPLEEASWIGDYEMVEILVRGGASAESDDSWSNAIEVYNPDDVQIVKILIDNGAPVNQKLYGEEDPLLHVAAWSPQEEAELYDMDVEDVEESIVSIYKTIYAHSKNRCPIDETTGKTALQIAQGVENEQLVDFIEAEQ